MNKFDWIKNDNIKDKNGKSLESFIPNLFTNYYIIHWKVGIIENFPFDNFPKDNKSIEDINTRIKIEREFDLFLNPNQMSLFKEINLKDLSQQFNLPYNATILSYFNNNPAIEILSDKTIDSLKISLSKLSSKSSNNLYVQDIDRYDFDKYNVENLNISINDYIQFQIDTGFDSTSYYFPDNLDWCLLTIEDYPLILCANMKVKLLFDLELFPLDYNEQI